MGSPRKNRPEAGEPAAPAAAKIRAATAPTTPALLAAALGVPVDHVEQLVGATCIAGEDFNDVGGEAVFTPAGLQKILARVQEQMLGTVAPSATGPTGAENVLPFEAAPLKRETLKLTRIFPWSTNLLAERANGLEVTVKVRNAALLKAGMVLVDCVPGETGAWFYEGRLPRMVGEQQLFYPAIKPATKGKR